MRKRIWGDKMKNLFKRITAALCAGLMLSFPVNISAEEIPENDITLPSGKTLKEVISTIASDCKATEDILDFASAEISIFKGDEELYTGYYGEVDKEKHIAADETSVYEWGSISKTLIWVSVMQLYEQGRIDLDKDVREYLPEGFFKNLTYDDPITMMNLMNHNAGWQETTKAIQVKDEKDIKPLGEALKEIEPAQVFRPGEITAYSNYGAAVAGYVVECITGEDFCDYVHENIFDVLGMEHTSLNPNHSDNAYVFEKRKEMHSYSTMFFESVDEGNCLYYIPCYPAGAAAGTLADLRTYAQAFVNDDAPLFKNPETQKLMFEGTAFYGDSDIPENCHGFWPEEREVRVYGHGGSTLFGNADMKFDPVSKIGFVVMVNQYGGNLVTENAPSLVFGHFPKDKYISKTDDKIDIKGYYLISRGVFKGLMKFQNTLTAISADELGDTNLRKLNDGLYVIEAGEHGQFSSVRNYENGDWGLLIQSEELIHTGSYLFALALLAAYGLTAVASFYMLRIRFKVHKLKKQSLTSGVITAGETAILVSVILLLTSYVYTLKFLGGLPEAAMTVFGTCQIICGAVCVVSAIAAVRSALKDKDKIKKTVCIINTVCSVICVSAIVYFEMYRFWGC